MAKQSFGKKTVAVVGSGLAGLTTAYILQNDPLRRYSVKIFEANDRVSLDAESLSLTNEKSGCEHRIDVPMRSFAGGFYRQLRSMYDFLGIQYHPQSFLFSFSASTPSKRKIYFIHSSNNHALPPLRPHGISWFRYLLELLFLLLTYAYWTFAAFAIPPRPSEPLGLYVRRIFLPTRFTTHYLLPLMSSVSTCTHGDMLAFPAADVLAYKRTTTGELHYAVSNGVGNVSARLIRGIDIQFASSVTHVASSDGSVTIAWKRSGDSARTRHTATFDHVVLALAPNVVGTVFEPLRDALSCIPTVSVESIVSQDKSYTCRLEATPTGASRNAQLIAFHSHHGRTDSTHVQPGGALVMTRVSDEKHEEREHVVGKLQASRFPRVLRTPQSRNLVNSVFDCGPVDASAPPDEKRRLLQGWKNGQDNVWIAGGWCWDGMVLLEGCVVSAMRVAKGLGVDAPWTR